MKRISLIFLWLLLAVQPLAAHGLGKQQLERVEAGPFRVTVWTDPIQIQAEKELHVTVAVEDAEGLVLNADVNVVAVKGSKRISAKATHDQSANKLHYEAQLVPDEAGEWEIIISVENEVGGGMVGFRVDVDKKKTTLPYGWIAGMVIGLVVIGFMVRNRVRQL